MYKRMVIFNPSLRDSSVKSRAEEQVADAMDVDPDLLLFTQDSIACKFRPPFQNQRIDDAVDSILRGQKKASDFRRLEVVLHEGRLWSLDNRRLWVFKKARVRLVTVNLVPSNHHSRFTDLMENKPELVVRILEKGYWPVVRGLCRTEFPRPDGICARPPPPRPVYVDEETDYGTRDRIRPISIPECQVPIRSRSNRHVRMEPDEDVNEPAVNDSGSQTKVLVGVTIIIVALLTCAHFGREVENKLLRVVKGTSGRIVREPTTSTHSLAADCGRGILSILFRLLDVTFRIFIPAVISWAFRVVWGLMWRLVCWICILLFSWKGF